MRPAARDRGSRGRSRSGQPDGAGRPDPAHAGDVTPQRTTGAATLLCGRPRSSWPARLCPDDQAGLVHAVEVHRSAEEVAGENEVALCGAIVQVLDSPWPPAAEPCPRCRDLAGGV